MITTQPGARTTATLEGAPARRTITARLRDGDEILTTVVTVAPLLDSDGMALDAYTATFTAPPALPVVIEWLEGGVVVGSELVSAFGAPVPGEPTVWTPGVAELAALLPARTVDDNGIRLNTFTTATRPTAGQAGALIRLAVDEVAVAVAAPIGVRHYQAARNVAALRAAMSVEVGYFPEQTESRDSAYARFNRQYDAGLATLVEAVRRSHSTGVRLA